MILNNSIKVIEIVKNGTSIFIQLIQKRQHRTGLHLRVILVVLDKANGTVFSLSEQ